MKRIIKIIRNTTFFFIIYLIISFLAISLYPVLIDRTITLAFSGKIVYSLISSLVLLIPSIFYVSRKTTGDYIDAVKIEELQISESEVKEAISNWVFVKYGKPIMGEVEIDKSDSDGKINYIVNVVQD